jgi:hypothetical protein
MIYLGLFKAGDSVFFGANFHNDQGTIEDPTSPEAQQRTPAGVWSALTAPSKQNSKTGFYGGTIDTTGFAVGEYVVRMAGTVTTTKTVATLFSFTVRANTEADIKTDTASIKTDTTAIKAKTDNLPADPAGLANLAAAHGAGSWQSESGAGAISQTFRIKDSSGALVDGAEVWVTNDAAGLDVVAGTLHSNAGGLVTFMLDSGTYYVWAQRAGVDFSNPMLVTV